MIESSNIMVSEKEGEGEAMGVDTETEEVVEVRRTGRKRKMSERGAAHASART